MMEERKTPKSKQVYEGLMDQFLLENYGAKDRKYISGIGFTTKTSGNNLRVAVKVHVPKPKIHHYQAFAMYLMLLNIANEEMTVQTPKGKPSNQKSLISIYVRKIIEDKIIELVKSKDTLFNKAEKIIEEYNVFRQDVITGKKIRPE